MGLFEKRKQVGGKTQVPVWFMRQAGRYHRHYQGIRKDHDFMGMCKNPELACEITMGPIDEFDFDGAILFSDLLFPLEQLSMGLTYESGPPTLAWHLENLGKISELKLMQDASSFYNFQQEALKKIRSALPQEKSLLGFVGAPFTLYTYAVEGSHSGNLVEPKKGLYDGRFEAFCDVLLPQLLQNISIQAAGNPDAICLFDTAVGELTLSDFRQFITPKLHEITKYMKQNHPGIKVIYYSRNTHLNHLLSIEDDNIDVLGVDWRHDLSQACEALQKDYWVQGNFDPAWLHLPWPTLESKLQEFWSGMQSGKVDFSRWVMGLGHGVLVKTPQENVKKMVEYIHQNFLY